MNLKKLFKNVESALNTKQKLLIGVLVMASLLLNIFLTHDNTKSATVMITNMSKRSGGSGVILNSFSNKSEILTNAHVCGVVEHGGFVLKGGQEFLVSSYKLSKLHDICLITVQADLNTNTQVASNAPKFYDEAIISGHPNLLPTIITKGHYSGRRVIEVLTGFRACTEEEKNSDTFSILCTMLGKIPVIRRYQSGVVTATIMAGSSGSGVYNTSNELGGLVFAGSGGGVSYAFIVPHEYVQNFVERERHLVEEVRPEYVLSADDLLQNMNKQKTEVEVVFEWCSKSSETNETVARICKVVKRDVSWRLPETGM